MPCSVSRKARCNREKQAAQTKGRFPVHGASRRAHRPRRTAFNQTSIVRNQSPGVGGKAGRCPVNFHPLRIVASVPTSPRQALQTVGSKPCAGISAGNFRRHHPLNHLANETSRIRTSVKLRQKAATNLSQFVAFCRREFAAICRLQPKAFIARTPYSLAEPRFFVRATATIRPAC